MDAEPGAGTETWRRTAAAVARTGEHDRAGGKPKTTVPRILGLRRVDGRMEVGC